MAYDEKLAERVRQALGNQDGVVEKKMFGGLAFMLHGNMSVGVEKDRLMVRVGADRYEEALARPHARPMDFTGRPMKGFVYVPLEGVSTDASLQEWVQLGVDFALTLPSTTVPFLLLSYGRMLWGGEEDGSKGVFLQERVPGGGRI